MSRRSGKRRSTTSRPWLIVAVILAAAAAGLFWGGSSLQKLLANSRAVFGGTKCALKGSKYEKTPDPQASVKHDIIAAHSKTADGLQVDEIIKSMSLEEKVGQLLMIGFSGREPDYYVNRMIKLRHIGGVILFGRNIADPVQVGRLTNQLQSLSVSGGDLPLFMAVDQEWGEISRFRDGITVFPGSPELGRAGSAEQVRIAARDTAEELRAMGINVNLAPVMDVAKDGSIMSGRSYGSNPELVAELGNAAVEGFRQGGVIPCAKHFPGLGKAVADPHHGGVKIGSYLSRLFKEDIVPFKRAINNNIEMIMVSNALYPEIDARNPAGFSKAVQTDLLRRKLGYRGLVLSDDLEMGAALSHGDVGQLAVEAVKAGTDIVLICHTPDRQKEAFDALLAAVKSGEISELRLNESLKRIISLKLKKKFDKNYLADTSLIPSLVNTPDHRSDAAVMAGKAQKTHGKTTAARGQE